MNKIQEKKLAVAREILKLRNHQTPSPPAANLARAHTLPELRKALKVIKGK